MSCYNWARLHYKYFTPNEVALPKNIKKSKMNPEEMKEWTLDNVENYYDYFPLLKTDKNGIIRVYYIDIRKSSDKYHFISRLVVTPTGKQIINLDILSWNEVKYRMPSFYSKITGKKHLWFL